jgi:hypothetical protein
MSDIGFSLDHLVGGHKQRGGHGETKRLRRLEIDGKFEFGWLADAAAAMGYRRQKWRRWRQKWRRRSFKKAARE